MKVKKKKERCQIKKKESVFIYISGDFLFLIINNSLIIARAYFLNVDFLKYIQNLIYQMSPNNSMKRTF